MVTKIQEAIENTDPDDEIEEVDGEFATFVGSNPLVVVTVRNGVAIIREFGEVEILHIDWDEVEVNGEESIPAEYDEWAYVFPELEQEFDEAMAANEVRNKTFFEVDI